MSVINKMLRDLEGQNNQKSGSRNYQPASGGGSAVPVWRVIFLCVLLVAALAWSWYTFTTVPDGNKTISAAPSPVPQAIAASQEVPVLAAASQQSLPADAEEPNMNSGIVPGAERMPSMQVKQTVSESGPVLIAEDGTKGLSVLENNTTSAAQQPAPNDSELPVPASVASSGREIRDNSVQPVPSVTAEQSPPAQRTVPQQVAREQRFRDGGEGPVIVFAGPPKAEQDKTPVTSSPDPKPQTTPAMSVSKAAPEKLEASLKDQINQAMKRGETREAIRLLVRLMQREPDDISVRKRLASVYFAEGQIEQAQQLLEQTLLKAPANTSVRLMLARLYVQQNLNDLVWEVIREPALSTDTDFLGFRAGFAQQQEKYETAMSDYSSLVSLQPDNARWWLGLGVAADKLNRNHMAVKAYQKAAMMQGLDSDVEAFIRQRLSDLTE